MALTYNNSRNYLYRGQGLLTHNASDLSIFMKAIRYLLSFAITLSTLCAEPNKDYVESLESVFNSHPIDIGYDFTEADLALIRESEDPGLPAEACVVGNQNCRFFEKLDLLTRVHAKLGADIEKLKVALIAPTKNLEPLQEFLNKYAGLIPLEAIYKGFKETKNVFNTFAADLAARADALDDEHVIDISDTQKQQILCMHGEFKKTVNKLIDQFDPIVKKIEKFKQNLTQTASDSHLDATLQPLVDEIINTCDDLSDMCTETKAALGPKVDVEQSAFSKWMEDNQETLLTGLGYTAAGVSYAVSEYFVARLVKPYAGVTSSAIIQNTGAHVALQTSFIALLELVADQAIWWIDESYKPKFDKFWAYAFGAAAYAAYTFVEVGATGQHNSPTVIAAKTIIPFVYAALASYRLYMGIDTNTHVKQSVKALETIIPLVTAAVLVNGFHMPWQTAR